MFGRRYARYQETRFKVLRVHVVTWVPRSWTDTAETTLRQSTGMTTMFRMARSFGRRAFEQQGLDPPDVARRVTQGQPPSAGRTRTRVRRTVRPSSSARLGLAMTNRAPWRAVTSTKSAW